MEPFHHSISEQDVLHTWSKIRTVINIKYPPITVDPLLPTRLKWRTNSKTSAIENTNVAQTAMIIQLIFKHRVIMTPCVFVSLILCNRGTYWQGAQVGWVEWGSPSCVHRGLQPGVSLFVRKQTGCIWQKDSYWHRIWYLRQWWLIRTLLFKYYKSPQHCKKHLLLLI